MRRSRQSRQPPIIHLSSMALSPSWSLSSSRRRPVVCGPRRSAAIGPCVASLGAPACRHVSSRTGHCPHCVAVALRWRARGACNGGSLCGHIAHTHDRSLATAIIALHSPRAPTVLGSIAARHSGCDLRHRQQTAVCVTETARIRTSSIFQTTPARTGAPAPPPCGGRGAPIECVTGRTSAPCADRAKLATSKATHHRHGPPTRGILYINIIFLYRTDTRKYKFTKFTTHSVTFTRRRYAG